MRLKAIIIVAAVCITTVLSAQQMTTCSTCYTPEELVQNVLVTGCISVSNVVYVGDPTALGSFDAAGSTFPFTSGVIMASGDIANAIGPNNSTGISSPLNTPGDIMLDALIPGFQTNDAAVLEFDFVPSNSLMEFRYIFGSDEYLEYVGTSFNDVFAFFLTGPNPSGGNYTNQNVAIIPTTTIPVSINNVNDTSYPAYYFDNGDGNAPNNEICQYDGYTLALIAQANVIPCTSYHIKLAIADAGDDALDSGVFLEAGSFGDPVIPTVENFCNVGNEYEIIEGCTDYYVFGRPPDMSLTDPLIINLNIGGTATNGVDITQFPTTVTIPAGQAADTVFYSGIIDDIPEGNEYLIFSLNGACPCNYSPISDTIWIIDNYTLIAGIVENDTSYCSADQVFQNMHTFIPPLTNPFLINYKWSTGSTNSSLYAPLNSGTTSTFYVTITDDCGQEAYDQVTFIVSDMSGLTFSSVDNICYGDAHGTINVAPVGGFNPYTYSWSPSDANPVNSGYSNTLAAGTYTVTVTDSLGCFYFVTLPVGQPDSLFFSYQTTDVTCYNGIDGSTSIQGFGGTPPYFYHWSTGSTFTGLDQIHGGYYLVTITDVNLCKVTTSIFVYEPDSLIVHPSPDVYMCLDQNAAISVTATGGTPAYYYLWYNDLTGESVGAGANITVSPLNTDIYYVFCTDINECIAAVDSVVVNIYPAIGVQLNTPRDSICNGESTIINAPVTGGTGGPYNCYLLDGASSVIAAPPFTVSPVHTTTYQVVAQDFCGSPQGIASITIYVFNPPDVIFTSDVNEGCKPLTVNFEELNGQPGMIYKWNFGDGTNSLLADSANPAHVFMSEGKFDITLTLTSHVGCVNSGTIDGMITVHPNPDARFTPDYNDVSILKPIIFFQNNSQGSIINYWSFGDNSPVSNSVSPEHTFPALGTYLITLITQNEFGCRDTAYAKVNIRDEYTMYTPNAFNPNSSIPENRTFMPIGYGIDPDNYHFIVYDRWGNKVYETFDLEHPWDGNTGSNKADIGSVYPWVVLYRDFNGTDHRVSGTVTIVN